MLWMLFCSILALMSFRWRSISFLVLFCFISVEISEIQLVCDRRTDRPTNGWKDGPTDGPTDIPSYRDVRTHLKTRGFHAILSHCAPPPSPPPSSPPVRHPCTLGRNGLKTTRRVLGSSARSFASSANSITCSTLHAFGRALRSFVCLLAHSLAPKLERKRIILMN